VKKLPAYFVLMNKNTPILSCAIDEMTNTISKITQFHNPDYLPIGISADSNYARKDLNKWFMTRSIPASRQGLACALVAMGISSVGDLLTKGLGLSLSDQYWLNPEGEIKWKDVNFFDNSFSEEVGDILFGEAASDGEPDLASPDNTSDGWLKKRWKIIDGKRCLIKGGSEPFMQEPVNEAFVSILIQQLGFDNYLKYDLKITDSKPYSVCENFITPDTELVTAQQILSTAKKPNDVSWSQHFLNCCESLEIEGAQKYLDFMLTLDYVVLNEDRHTSNFGAIRNVNTLKFEGMAPIFDNGTSLWRNKSDFEISAHSPFETKPFNKDPDRQLGLVTSFEGFDFARLDGCEETFSSLLSQSPTISQERRELLCRTFARRLEDISYRLQSFLQL